MRGNSRFKLSHSELSRLQKIRKHCSESRVVRRATALLMLTSGLLVEQVCQVTGLTRRGIEKIRERWNTFKLKSLVDRPGRGRPARAIPMFRRLLVRTVKISPLKFGYGFTVWNTGRLAEHLFRETGIRLCQRRISQLLREEGFSFGVPAHTLKGKRSERKHRRSQKRLKSLKKGLCGPILLFVSASGTRAGSISSPI